MSMLHALTAATNAVGYLENEQARTQSPKVGRLVESARKLAKAINDQKQRADEKEKAVIPS